MDINWTYEGQEDKAFHKGISLLAGGCTVSEFGTRRRRDYHTQALVLKGLGRAREEGQRLNLPGKISGTSNVHLAKRFGLLPIGTVAHEWFMGVAAIENDYENATEKALQYWMGCFGEGVLAIALTDTFGTPAFLRAFAKPVAPLTNSSSSASTRDASTGKVPSYGQVFTGVRQDSGDPATFVKMMRKFYDDQGITDKKTIVFSDSLDINLCLHYKSLCDEAGMIPSFGVGTFLTNDFVDTITGKKSVPLNIVIKISSANGRPAVKISDNIGKNTGDQQKIAEVKRALGYEEKEWAGGDETTRWGTGET
jgi:nicotinate phosphoribosyltransferase